MNDGSFLRNPRHHLVAILISIHQLGSCHLVDKSRNRKWIWLNSPDMALWQVALLDGRNIELSRSSNWKGHFPSIDADRQ
jgi:hypothetical protein